jgi:hypothetical protein
MPRFFDPNLNHDHHRYQKRVPKGHEGGGQWTAEDFHLMRALSRPAPAHPRVIPPSPRVIPPVDPTPPQVTPHYFESTGPLPFSIEALEQPLRAAADMYERLSRENTAGKRATATFRAREFLAGDAAAVQVKDVDVDRVKAVCKKFDKVQAFLDSADAKTEPTRFGFNEAQRGTRIHWLVADEINRQRDPAFRAEISVVKTLAALKQEASDRGTVSQQILRDKGVTEDYGKRGTRRFDALEFPNHTTVCDYEIKTAEALLGFKHMDHFAELLFKYGNKQIIVIQMKPSHLYRR